MPKIGDTKVKTFKVQTIECPNCGQSDWISMDIKLTLESLPDTWHMGPVVGKLSPEDKARFSPPNVCGPCVKSLSQA